MTELRRIAQGFQSRPRGAVLLLVICAVAILTVLAVEVAHRARLDVNRGQRTASALVIKRAFDSGIAVARGLLWESRKNPAYDYFGDAWSKPLNVDLKDGAVIRVQVYDESGKLNLTQLMGHTNAQDNSDRTLARLFNYLKKHDSMRAEQWKDTEAQVRQRLGIAVATDKPESRSTHAQIAPLMTLDGLREAGVPAELIFGSSGDQGERSGLVLCDLVTTFGDGHINLNTAPEGVLSTLDVEYDDTQVNAIMGWRGQRLDDGAGDFKAFQEPKDLEHVEGIVRRPAGNDSSEPEINLYAKVQERLSVRSSCFAARIEVAFGAQRKLGWAFFDVSKPAVNPAVDDISMLAFEELEP